MQDVNGLAVTAQTVEQLDIINQTTDILFKKCSGIEKYLPLQADQNPACPMLQINTAILYFYSTSVKTISEKLPIYLDRIQSHPHNLREGLHLQALQDVLAIDLTAALQHYIDLITQFPQDKTAIVMLQACAFFSGQIKQLLTPYAILYPYHKGNPDFLGMHAFLLAHSNRLADARQYAEIALQQEPHNAWLQHVYIHTLDESNPEEIQKGIHFMEVRTMDWPTHSRLYEGHNWMHLSALYFLRGNFDMTALLTHFSQHIWGKSKKFIFEQNNAFWFMWMADLHGYGDQIPREWRVDLATHAEVYTTDYFTPYLTVSAILSVALVDLTKASKVAGEFEQYAQSNTKNLAWRDVAWPLLQGCLAYLKGDYQGAYDKLHTIDNTRTMGHSDEQRTIFSATGQVAKKKLGI